MDVEKEVPIDQIAKDSNIRNEDVEIADLMASIEVHGLLQPIVVSKKKGGGYKLVAGHRRFLACSRLGMKTIPAVVRSFKKPKLIQITENMQRKDLSKVEESKVIYELKQDLDCSISALCRHLGRDFTWVKKRLAYHEVRQYLINVESLPIRSINSLTFDIAVRMVKHPKKFWVKMAAESLGKRWYPEEIDDEFKAIADPGYIRKSKSQAGNQHTSGKASAMMDPLPGGAFSIMVDRGESILKLLFVHDSDFKKMIPHLENMGGEVI